jgi:hypothetical protein
MPLSDAVQIVVERENMNGTFEFGDTGLVISDVGPPIDEIGIARAIPDSFPGKNGFIAFYLTYNGLYFPRGAVYYRDRFRSIPPQDHNRLTVSNFLFIPRSPGEEDDYLVSMIHARDNMIQKRPDLCEFLHAHLQFASDASGNDFWIELPTGRVKYRPLEEFESARSLVDVAPSFIDFAAGLEAWSPARKPAAP